MLCSLGSGSFLKDHNVGFLQVDCQGPGLAVLLQQVQVLDHVEWETAEPDHLICEWCRVRPGAAGRSRLSASSFMLMLNNVGLK